LDGSIAEVIDEINNEIDSQRGALGKYISKRDLSNALEGVSVEEGATFEEVRAQLSALLNNLKALVSDDTSDTPDASAGEE